MASIIQVYGVMLLESMGNTLLLCGLSLLVAMVIGLIIALFNVGKNRVLNLIGTIFVDAVRGVPLIVLAYFVYFGVPQAAKMLGVSGFRLSALSTGKREEEHETPESTHCSKNNRIKVSGIETA